MKKVLTLMLLLTTSISIVQAQPCATPFKIVVIGSSTSAGAGVSVSDSAYVNRYRKFLVDSVNPGCTIINIAIGGATTYKMQPTGFMPPSNRSSFTVDTARNITKAISLNPDGIIINYPSNDVASGFSLQEQKDNFLRVMAKADSAGLPVWITTTQPRNFTDTIQLNKQFAMRDWITATYGPQRYIDFWTGIATTTGIIESAYNSGDGVHLNNAGHRLLLGRVKARGIHTALCPVTTEISLNRKRIINVFPNPVYDQLTVHIDDISANTSCRVFDISGRQVPVMITHNTPKNELSIIGFGNLAPGIYWLKVTNGTETMTKLVTKAL